MKSCLNSCVLYFSNMCFSYGTVRYKIWISLTFNVYRTSMMLQWIIPVGGTAGTSNKTSYVSDSLLTGWSISTTISLCLRDFSVE